MNFFALSLNLVQQVKFKNSRLDSLSSLSFKLNHIKIAQTWFGQLDKSKDNLDD